MNGIIHKKQQIRKIVQYLKAKEDLKWEKVFSEFNPPDGNNQAPKIIWIVFTFTCCVICCYQIGELIEYYRSEPKVLNVDNDVVKSGDLPMITLCNSHVENNGLQLKYFDDYWRAMNTVAISSYYTLSNKIYSKTTMKTRPLLFGMCTDIFNVAPLPIGDSTLKLHIVINTTSPILELFINTKNTRFINIASFDLLKTKTPNKFSVIADKYKFLNSKNYPCVTAKDFEKCQFECERNYIKNYLAPYDNLSFPFMTPNKPKLVSSHRVMIWDELTEEFIIAFGWRNPCNCTIQCEFTLANLFSDFNTDNPPEMQVFFQSVVVRTLREQFSYGIVDLLCNIGGNLGLYLGLSILSIVNVTSKVISNILSRRKLSPKLFPKTPQRLNCLIKKIHDVSKFTEDNIKNRRTCSLWNSVIKILLFFLCMYSTYDRIMYYLTYHTSNKIVLVRDTIVPTITFIVCTGTHLIQPKFTEFAKMYNKSVDDVEFLDLLLSPFNVTNYDQLWIESSNLHVMRSIVRFRYQLLPRLTVFGNCTVWNRTVETSTAVLFIAHTNRCKYRVFFIPSGHILNPKNSMMFYCNQYSTVTFKKQGVKVVIRLNTPANPCVTTDEWEACERNCYNAKFLEKNITCSLPFTQSSNRTLCNSWESASKTCLDYLKAYISTNPKRDCLCSSPCNESLYIMTNSYRFPFGANGIIFKQEGFYWEVIEQQLSFPFLQLLCDIGSNLGCILGISVLSAYNLVHSFLQGISYCSIKMHK